MTGPETRQPVPSDGVPDTPDAPALADAPDEVAFQGSVRPTGPSRATRGGMVVGAAALVVVGAVAAMGASPSPSTNATPSTGAAPGRSTAPDGSGKPGEGWAGRAGRPGLGFPGIGPGFGRDGIGGGDITITSIDGPNLALRTADGWTRTIAIASDTTLTRAGKTIPAGDLAVGDRVAIREQRQTDGSYAITAIEVVLPTVVGQVTAVDGSSITVTVPGGTATTIHVGSGTTYSIAGKADAASSDIKVGTMIVATGTQRSDGSLDAEAIRGGFGFMDGGRGPGHDGAHGPTVPGATASPSASGTTS